MSGIIRYKRVTHLVVVMLLLLGSVLVNRTALADTEPWPMTEIVLDESGAPVEIPVEEAPLVEGTPDPGNVEAPLVEGTPDPGNVDQTPAQPNPAPDAPARGKAIPGQYIVVLKSGADPRAVAAVARVSPKYVYDAALNGFAAQLNRGQLTALQHNPNVDYIEQDMVATIDVTQNMDANGDPWGLDRIDQGNLPLSKTYTYNKNGAGVRAYIIDTGLQVNHSQFGGRAANSYDAFGGNGNDCNGHGTHVGGTVAGTTYGVAKGALPRGVRVLDCNGSGSNSGIIAGINWVTSNHIKPAVANMSLGGGFSSSVNTAVANMISAGVFTAVAAGNSNANACNYSPSSTSTAYTVAASSKTDAKASFSNYGSCVDGYGPGVAIKSVWINSGVNTISGTSMASPHVAGVGALYQSNYGTASAAAITNWINSNATTNKITSNPSGTPNRLLSKRGL